MSLEFLHAISLSKAPTTFDFEVHNAVVSTNHFPPTTDNVAAAMKHRD